MKKYMSLMSVFFAVTLFQSVSKADISAGRYFGKTSGQIGCYLDVVLMGTQVSSLKFYYQGVQRANFVEISKKEDPSKNQIFMSKIIVHNRVTKVIKVISAQRTAFLPLVRYGDTEIGAIDCLNMGIIK